MGPRPLSWRPLLLLLIPHLSTCLVVVGVSSHHPRSQRVMRFRTPYMRVLTYKCRCAMRKMPGSRPALPKMTRFAQHIGRGKKYFSVRARHNCEKVSLQPLCCFLTHLLPFSSHPPLVDALFCLSPISPRAHFLSFFPLRLSWNTGQNRRSAIEFKTRS